MDFKIIAVDFDGTLCTNKWPEIGEPNHKMITYLKERQAAGDKLILWTCRVDEILNNAVRWCRKKGLIFDAVNENLPNIIAEFGTDTRKIFANEYIDDRNAWLPSEKVADILYFCDGKQCGETCPSTECKHTSNISHAKNFIKDDYDSYWEEESKKSTRLCKVGDRIGYFHSWEHYSKPIEASPLIGGAPAGVFSCIFAIVEFSDGVERVAPTRVYFCDESNAFLNFTKPKEQEEK